MLHRRILLDTSEGMLRKQSILQTKGEMLLWLLGQPIYKLRMIKMMQFFLFLFANKRKIKLSTQKKRVLEVA